MNVLLTVAPYFVSMAMLIAGTLRAHSRQVVIGKVRIIVNTNHGHTVCIPQCATAEEFNVNDVGDNNQGPISVENELMHVEVTRRCVLVAGMHRSGTSFACGILAQLGLQRALRELPPQPDNPKGFFEPSSIVSIHDRILAVLGSKWDDWRRLPDDWQRQDNVKALLDILKTEFLADYPIPGTPFVKDPRISILLDAWIEMLASLAYRPFILIVFRHPLDVARSLHARNGVDLKLALLIWLRHVLESERKSRELDRHFVHYDGRNLSAKHLQEIMTSHGIITLEIQEHENRAFYDENLHHNKQNSFSDHMGVERIWYLDVFSSLIKLSSNPYDVDAIETLDRTHASLEISISALDPVLVSCIDPCDT